MKCDTARTTIGRRYSRLTIIGEPFIGPSPRGTRNVVLVPCRCDCGIEKNAMRASLLKGSIKSCGCFQRERQVAANFRHGHASGGWSPTFSTWQSMLTRCRNASDPGYRKYGARGTTVCERWLVFDNFLADMGERPPGTTIDRINVAGNYEPANCRWADNATQQRNKHTSHFLEFNGQRKNITDWARELGIHHAALVRRIQRGWSIEQAFTKPMRETRKISFSAELRVDLQSGLSSAEVAKKHGVSASHVRDLRNGRTPVPA